MNTVTPRVGAELGDRAAGTDPMTPDMHPGPAYIPAVLRRMQAEFDAFRSGECSLVFANVSGFTPLTERYARRGRDGSELLTDLLNDRFAPTLGAALELGGDLLSFGGDALLVLFEGDGHAAAALSAAFAMQRRFTAAARQRRVKVSMSVGVSTGTLALHRVGGRFDFLICCGPVVDSCLRLESAATEGQILVDVEESAIAAVAAELVEHGSGRLLVDVGGGKFTLTAGVPFTTGDDADRMLMAAVDIVTGADPKLRVRIGVNEGPVFAAPVGSPERMSYTIMGDDVNLAARVMGRSSPGRVLATRSVADRSRSGFAFEHVEPFMLKGKSEAVEAALVTTASNGGFRESTPEHRTLVGRDAELAMLLELARAPGPGSTEANRRVVELIGEPGLGKSRLVAELVSRSSRRAVMVECGRYLSSSPYGAIAHAVRTTLASAGDPQTAESRVEAAIREAVRDRAPHLVPWLPFVGLPAGVDFEATSETAGVAEEFRLRRVHQVATEFVLATTTGAPLLVIEDSHWIDEASAELLDHAIPRLTGAGWMVVVTRRPEPSALDPGEDSVRVQLRPLDDEAVSVLTRQLTESSPLSNHVIDALVERSQGNPLFLGQLVLAVEAGGEVEELPDRVEVLIESRIDRLPAQERAALRAAAVLGARFDARILDAVEPGATAHLDALGELLVSDGSKVRFRHALFRDTAYLTLPSRERRRRHARVAETLESEEGNGTDEVVQLLAVHWDRAGRPDRAFPHLCAAAKRASDDLAPTEAVQLFESALRCARRLGPEQRAGLGPLYEQLGGVHETLGHFESAEHCYRHARRRCDDDTGRARLLDLETRVARSIRSLATATRRYRKALAMLPDDEHVVRATLLVGRCSVLEYEGRHREKLPLLEEALLEAERGADRRTLAHAHLLLGNTFGDLGMPGSVEHLQTALDLFGEAGDIWGTASSRNNLGVEAYYLGDWNASLDHYSAATEDYRRLGDETNHAMTLNNIGEIHSDQGRWAEATHELNEARRMWRAAGFQLGVALASSNLGRLAASEDRIAEAEHDFALSRSLFEDIAARGFLLELDARRASAALRFGDAEEGRRLGREVLDAGGDLEAAAQVFDRLGVLPHARLPW